MTHDGSPAAAPAHDLAIAFDRTSTRVREVYCRWIHRPLEAFTGGTLAAGNGGYRAVVSKHGVADWGEFRKRKILHAKAGPGPGPGPGPGVALPPSKRLIDLPCAQHIIAMQVHRGGCNRGVAQVVPYGRQSGASSKGVARMAMVARCSFSASAGWADLRISAACRKNLRMMCQSRAPAMPASPSSPRLATNDVLGFHCSGVTGNRRCTRHWSSASRASGGSATRARLPPLPVTWSH